MRRTIHQRHAASGQPGLRQRWRDGECHDRARRRESIAADAEHDGVAAPQHTARVGQHVGPAFEDEGDDTEGSAHQFDAESVVAHGVEHRSSTRWHLRPSQEALDHLLPHGIRHAKPSRRPATTPGVLDVDDVDGRDLRPNTVVRKGAGGMAVEGDDRVVGHVGHFGEGGRGGIDRDSCRMKLGCRDMKEPGFHIGEQTVARSEVSRQIVTHGKRLAVGSENRGAWFQLVHVVLSASGRQGILRGYGRRC